ncbi:Ca-activated chloride channel family protein [Catenuloplanes nepalensis]|uniref:Ca-activated chloride channel family protein n=1 Tax=Catenuloplanes nepalensis TaxID=587533 RepID=A0ABT9MS08_9ACTN|nr:VWA domain-containing protein [Catenuloplanes nepalensis]MDP9794207.1 Ca-activated chloride channel family protein [Catenuloplanes nepalensis]
MNDPSLFSLSIGQNTFVPIDASDLYAILAVESHADGGAGALPEAAEVILVDSSGSMEQPPAKMTAARHAAAAAIDALRDGMRFAVVTGNHEARPIYPRGGTAIADPRTRAEAKAAIRHIIPGGGTAMGTWLTEARTLLAPHHGAVRHAILLTDGRNEHETRAALNAVLDACQGTFSCDARGIGDDWSPAELIRIASVLGGGAEAIRGEAELVEDFTALAGGTGAKRVAQARLRIRTAHGVSVAELKQVFPASADLTEHLRRVDGRTVEAELGAWGGTEIREYSVRLAIGTAGELGEDFRAGTAEVLTGTDGVRQGRAEAIVVHRTEDTAISSQVDASLGYYQLQAETGRAIQAVVELCHAERYDEAGRAWAEADELARLAGNDEAVKRLGRIVAPAGDGGPVRVLRPPRPYDLLALEIYQVRPASQPHLSSQLQTPGEPGEPGAPVERAHGDRTCPACGYRPTPEDDFCADCGTPLPDVAA